MRWIACLLFAAVPWSASAQTSASLAIFRLSGVDPALGALLTDDVVAEVRAVGELSSVVTPAEVDTRLGGVGQDVVRSCAQDQCALVDTEIAGAIGVTHILVGGVAQLGTQWVVTLRIIELRTAREVASARAVAERQEKLPATARIAANLALQQAGLLKKSARVRSGDDGGMPLPKLAAFGVAGGAAVVGALMLVGGVLVAGVIEGLVVTAWYVYPVPTPTSTVQQRINALNGLTVAGALAGLVFALAGATALGAAALAAGAGATL